MKRVIKKTANQESFFTVMSYFMLLTSVMNIYNIYIHELYMCIHIYVWITRNSWKSVYRGSSYRCICCYDGTQFV